MSLRPRPAPSALAIAILAVSLTTAGCSAATPAPAAAPGVQSPPTTASGATAPAAATAADAGQATGSAAARTPSGSATDTAPDSPATFALGGLCTAATAKQVSAWLGTTMVPEQPGSTPCGFVPAHGELGALPSVGVSSSATAGDTAEDTFAKQWSMVTNPDAQDITHHEDVTVSAGGLTASRAEYAEGHGTGRLENASYAAVVARYQGAVVKVEVLGASGRAAGKRTAVGVAGMVLGRPLLPVRP